MEKEKEYIYIVQSSKEPAHCKIGKTNSLETRLNDYNTMTGKSKDAVYQYLLACEVKNMTKVEHEVKHGLKTLKIEGQGDAFFCNTILLKEYAQIIKTHPLFIKAIIDQTTGKKEAVKPAKKAAASSKSQNSTHKKAP
jgi:hypothetical protein